MEVEVHRLKRAAEGWRDVWKKSEESELCLQLGWDGGRACTPRAAGAGFHLGTERGKGRCFCPGFYISTVQCGKSIFPEHQSSTASTQIFNEISLLCWTQVLLKHLVPFGHGLSCLYTH